MTVTIPTSTPLGTYFLLACADDAKVVPETDETNNCVASAGTVQVTLPDLVETAVTNPPPAAKPGGTLGVTDTTKNQGAVAAAASTTRYYLSLNTLRDSGDLALSGSRSVPSLAPGATSTGSVTVTIPTSAPSGTYFLLACADDGKVVPETNEANNCVASTTPVIVGP